MKFGKLISLSRLTVRTATFERSCPLERQGNRAKWGVDSRLIAGVTERG